MPAWVAAGTLAILSAVVADAGAGVIFAAIWAMKVPSPIMIAAKIIMLRMTLHNPRKLRTRHREISSHPRQSCA